MTALGATDGSAGSGPYSEDTAVAAAEAAPAVAGPMAGDPAVLGLPSFIAGSVVLGLALVGVVPAGAVGAALPIILAATAAGLFLATIWSAAIGQSAVACIFGIFAGFWFSYALLLLGLFHNWLAIATGAAAHSQELFLASWLVIIVMLTLATLRLPLAFTVVFALIDLALLLLLLATANASTGLTKTGGYVVLLFAAVGVYLFFSSVSVATGGKPLPLGKPVLH